MDKKEEIILSAMKLFVENGVQGTPMSAIAKAAATGMGTIYNYFATKEDLINAIYLYIKHQEANLLRLPFTDKSIKRQFDHIYEAAIHYLVSHPLHFQFMEQFQISPILTSGTKKIAMRETEGFMILISEGREQDIIKQINSNELVYFIHGGLMGFVRWVLINNIPLTDKLISNQRRIAWDAIKQ